ncbi:MAG: Uma2 family endonuclease [Acidobacteriaceae bacterium]|nr:Uma2 family endonuclease [Acidobacteriaceae bacterium]MBV9295573.1 Uma2 family endonuclease [Acidobacteriaceae bacterium]MBV9763990.1 Uma2 family endonuclease [Acidobacteriaceae bacterium]
MAAVFPLALDVAALERVIVRPVDEFTDDDFFDFCQEHELLRIERNSAGEIIIMAPVGTEGGFAELEVAAELRDWAKKNGRGIVLSSSAGVTLPDKSVFSPDACWIPIERWKAVPPGKRRKFAPLLPAFVIEVRSPSDRRKDLHEKMLSYIRNGVELGWMIDPQSRTVSIYKPGQETPVELNDPQRVKGEGPVTGFVLDLKRIYDQLG